MEYSFSLPRLRTGIKPFRLYWFPRLRSTNDHAARLRKAGELFAPAIVLTGRQTAGRGRGSHNWWSSTGCLTVTFILPVEEHLLPYQLPLIAGLAVRRAVAELTGTQDIQLKWPNDLVYHGRKLAGLLCQRLHKADLIGLGFNINLDPKTTPPSLRRQITSLSQIAGRSFDMTDVLIQIARELYLTLSQRTERQYRQFLNEYSQHDALLGRRVTILNPSSHPPLTGRCEGLDHLGRLLLRQNKTLHHILSGSVIL